MNKANVESAVHLLCCCLLVAGALHGAPGFGQSSVESGEARIALVIGNGAYSNVPLKNSTNDARDMAAALQKLGFSVNLLVDADFPAMNRAVRDFGNAIRRPDAVALFYFSGHGVQYRGANYLVPAKADIQDADELTYSALNAEQVYAKMESAGARTNIVILDACRNNPFPGAERAADRGLAVVGNVQPPQSLIVYATAPGKTAQDGDGRNGVFTGALLKHLADPNLDVELMIRRVREDVMAATSGAQVPWHSSSISGEGFAFLRAPAAADPGASAPPASTPAPPAKTTSTVSFTSDPSGVLVVIDDREPVETPLSVELPPGSHSYGTGPTFLDDMYYEGHPRQNVEIEAGKPAVVAIKLQPVTTGLAFRLVPPGYTVLVNGEKLGVTPLAECRVKAGRLTVRFERVGEPPRSVNVLAVPGRSNLAAWGQTEGTAVQLSRRQVQLNGKADSWAGLEPIYEWPGASSGEFMGQAGAAIARVFMCRDDRNLYWRLDFDGSNPLRKIPPGVKKSLDCFLKVRVEGNKVLQLSISFDRQRNQLTSWMGSLNELNGQWTLLANNCISYDNGERMLVAAISLDRMRKYLSGPQVCQANLVNNGDRGWLDSLPTEVFYVDFGR